MNYSDNLLVLDFIFGYKITFSVTKIGKKKRLEFKLVFHVVEFADSSRHGFP